MKRNWKAIIGQLIREIRTYTIPPGELYPKCPKCNQRHIAYRLVEADKGRLWDPHLKEYVDGYKYVGVYDEYYLCPNCRHVWGKETPDPNPFL